MSSVESAGDKFGLSIPTLTDRGYSALQKGGDPAAGSPTATLLRLRQSLIDLDGCPLRLATGFGSLQLPCVTGGVYKARERIHRGVADPRLLAIPGFHAVELQTAIRT